eukprot:TRINITY_DN23465_c0_g1_i1.p1 TRINITY_DN23465_c0_g1~~TRINITY_DN23465_c0_g1_i1.p1  ORF type:complete len:228 (+),score=34.61 TRINITY_DN23465_c0_g1_i1:106-789(+)
MGLGTVGIIVTDQDKIMWNERVRKENAVNGKWTSKFALRSVLNVPKFPEPPQTDDPTAIRGAKREPTNDFEVDIQKGILQKKSGPQGRRLNPETSTDCIGWTLSKSSPDLRASDGLTVHPDFFKTAYGHLSPVLQKQKEKTKADRERRLAEAEASVAQAMARSASYLNHGSTGSRHYKTTGETDATAFGNFFVKANNGVPLHKAFPWDGITPKLKVGGYAGKWKPVA